MLTGLNQRVGNFPGVTVDKKTGSCRLSKELQALLIDLPGTYSLYPRRADEWISYDLLMGMDVSNKPQIVVLVMDASNLKRNLLYCSQILDLHIPTVVALTMNDLAEKKGIQIDISGLAEELGVPVIPVNPLNNQGIETLKKVVAGLARMKSQSPIRNFIETPEVIRPIIDTINSFQQDLSDYAATQHFLHNRFVDNQSFAKELNKIASRANTSKIKIQSQDILSRYHRIQEILRKYVIMPDPMYQKNLTNKIDNILLHRVWGYIIMMAVLFILFQSVFWIAKYPMDAIDQLFLLANNQIQFILPDTWLRQLIIDGLMAGLNGIMVFLPQIMILFGLITIIEDSGYMARISFLSDKLMRKSGLNGKSVMPMISGFACAVPAIMSARNIENSKERLLTILVTPFMSCSARLPVFTILISLVIPDTFLYGFISLQGLVMMGLYLTGILIALVVSYLLHKLVRAKERSLFMLELPLYRSPRWKNVFTTMIEKAKIFAVDAGKIIIIISLLLWFLSSYGPAEKMDAVKSAYQSDVSKASDSLAKEEAAQKFAVKRLENSYAGIMGHFIEPVIQPLGFDWKIGLSLITSFAAREVFVGTMATLYSVNDEDQTTLKTKMERAVRSDGSKVYTLGTGVSLMLFYLLAMQCMSTLAVVKRETNTWKWPILQLLGMTVLAYLASWLAFTLLG